MEAEIQMEEEDIMTKLEGIFNEPNSKLADYNNFEYRSQPSRCSLPLHYLPSVTCISVVMPRSFVDPMQELPFDFQRQPKRETRSSLEGIG